MLERGMRPALFPTLLALLFLPVACGAGDNPNWRMLDPENLLVIDTSKGRIIVEMRPDLAPKAVERVKLLTREHVYDGLQFHRVIDGFVAQTGNPDNKDGGVSAHPNLAPEFTGKIDPGSYVPMTTKSDGASGFLGTLPIETTSTYEDNRRGDGKTVAWGAYCPGVVGMGRGDAPDSANSEIFFMRGTARRLDRSYTAWGMTVIGLDVLYKLNVGEPPAQPDVMQRVQVAADMDEDDRPQLSAEKADSVDFLTNAGAIRAKERADFSICDVRVTAELD